MAFILLVSSVFAISTFSVSAVTQPTALTSDGSYAGRNGDVTSYYSGASSSDFESYVNTLTTEGYAVVQSYDADGCYYKLLTKGTSTVYVSYLRSVSSGNYGRLRVFEQTGNTDYYTQKSATESNVCTSKLWQLDTQTDVNPIYGSFAGGSGGMSYVIRLTDGTFAIIDGGYNGDWDADNLYATLMANNVLDTKPVISAWFITHMHVDHYGALQRFSQKYSENVIVEGFFYNFPGEITLSDGTLWETNTKSVENSMKNFAGAKLYSRIHSGMTLGFAGATVEVLATHEDLGQSYYQKNTWNSNYSLKTNSIRNVNDTSTVLRFNIGGQKIIFLSDAYQGVEAALLNTHTDTYLKSDIMQMAHHGFNDGVSENLIGKINPDVVLWPMDVIFHSEDGTMYAYPDTYKDSNNNTVTDTKTFGYYYSIDNKSHVRKVKAVADEIITSYKNEELLLPYTAGTLYGEKGSNAPAVVNVEGAVAAKKAVHNDLLKEIYVQESNDRSKVRFIGVLNVTEEELENYVSVGFDISITYDGNTYTNNINETTVYTSIMADGVEVSASEYGGTYFYVAEISDLNNAIDSKAEFVVTGTAIYRHEDTNTTHKINYAFVKYVVDNEIKAADSGEAKRYSFSDIIAGAWKES